MKLIEGKMVLLGSQGVGKTSLIVNFIGKTISPLISPTIGASFFSCKINFDDSKVKLQIWDTAGQERFRAMAPMYYRNANIALIIFDLTQYESFDSVKTWVKELKSNIQELIGMILVGNKNDLESQRQVTQDEALEYAIAIGAEYYECSALKNEGVEEIFMKAGMELINLSTRADSTVRIYNSSENSQCTTVTTSISKNLSVDSNELQGNTEMPKKSSCCS